MQESPTAAVAVLASLTFLIALTACSAVESRTTSGEGERVVIVASATMNEPRPSLTARVVDVLRRVAEGTNVTDGRNGKSGVAVVTSADGGSFESVPLTPRRANGAVEHGFQRDRLIDANLRRVSDEVSRLSARKPLDLLEGIGNAVRGSSAGSLVVISSGLSTDGGLDLRQVGWQADPAQVAEELQSRNLLPALTGWEVLFTGFGDTAGTQPPLTSPAREKLTSYWTAICEAAGAASCRVDASRTDAAPPNSQVSVPVVPVLGITTITGPDGTVRTTLSNELLGFAGDSAELSPAAQELLKEYAGRIKAKLAGRPAATVTVRGYAADPPGSTERGRAELSWLRARAVAYALSAGGVSHHIDATGGGTAPGMTAMSTGAFDELVAKQMRRVEITC